MTTSGIIKVLSVDDHPLLREGIRLVIQSQPDMELVAEASNGQEAIDMFALHRPSVVLMDLQMPVMGGIEATIAIRNIAPSARIIVLTTYSGDVQAARALKAGASGYLLKNLPRAEFLQAIRDVYAGKRRIAVEIAAEIAGHVDADTLTQRELGVLKNVAEGNSNKCIASVLGLSQDTVKGHMRNIMAKLCANDRTHAVTTAMRRGYLEC